MLHKQSMYNKEILRTSGYCGCFYCCEIYDFNEIVEFTDNNQTAICPKCDVDSVVPTNDIKILEEMNKTWFLSYGDPL